MSQRACWAKRLPPNQLTTLIATHRIRVQSVSLTQEADSTRTSLIFRFPMPGGETGEAIVANVLRYLEDRFPLQIDLEPPNTYSFFVDGPNTLDLFGYYNQAAEATVLEPPPKPKGKGKAQAPAPAPKTEAPALVAAESVASIESSDPTTSAPKKRTRVKKNATT